MHFCAASRRLLVTSAIVFVAGLASACTQEVKEKPTTARKPEYASEIPQIDMAAWARWVTDFKKEAAAEGVSQKLLEQAFASVSPNERVLELDRKQPESTMTFGQYLDRVISAERIANGKRMKEENRALLDKVSAKYGVQPEYIVALWGVETSYGKITGKYSMVESLATLAFDGRRSDFFRSELKHALRIVDQGHIPLDDFIGSWAGAMGQCQFMPSSFHSFAQDGNGDGRKDIWNSREDVFASIANYLSKSGWNGHEGWGMEVTLPAGFDKSLTEDKTPRSMAEWTRMGVTKVDGSALPQSGPQASVVQPDDETGKAYLAYNNYRVIMKWNRSLYFASSVGILADHIKQ